MIKVIISNILLFLGYIHATQATSFESYKLPGDTLVKITGKVVNVDDSTSIPATILYQKLPYYDDMGMASAQDDSGEYEMFMIKNVKYSIMVKASGFDTIEEEYVVADNENAGLIKKHFYLSPDADNRRISLDNLIFASSSATISKGSYSELDDLAKWMSDRPSKIIQLEGHTDFQGSATANMQLSQDRVDAVKSYLSKKGIKKNRIRTKAFGGTQPLTKERTPEGKAKNRRVEVRILN
ncbi:MAG: OmpA family protein [Bacteroidota bacterium]